MSIIKKIASQDYVSAEVIEKVNGAIENFENAYTSVLYTEQELTDEQKSQARANIGASDVKSYNDLTNKPTIPSIDGLASESYVDIRVPAWTSSDEGKFLRIVNGTPTWATVNNAEEVGF